MKLHGLDYYDNRPAPVVSPTDPVLIINRHFLEFPSTHAADKAELVFFGVDGDVPFELAAANVGLIIAANDNRKKIAARAA